MKKKLVWLVLSGLMVLALVLAACAPAVTEEEEEVVVTEEEKVVVTEEEEVVAPEEAVEMVRDALGQLVEKPQYGGWLNAVYTSDPRFANHKTLGDRTTEMWFKMTNELLVYRDRLKGPAAPPDQQTWRGQGNWYNPPEDHIGGLAESWEIILPDTLKFKIRQGVYWEDKAPTNGAEVTAEDIVYSVWFRYVKKGAQFSRKYPHISDLENPQNSIYVDPADPWAVVMKARPGDLAGLWERTANYMEIVPAALGDPDGCGFCGWEGIVGSGPFRMTDWTKGSSITWERKDDYWMFDQLHPENRLPYIDGVRMFILPDLSTQQAAFRTGKLDILLEVGREDAQSLLRTNPELRSVDFWKAEAIAMRQDKPPFDDVRVRQAMMMAIDHDEIQRDLFLGRGMRFYWPAWPIPEHEGAYVPLEEMPEIVQQMYGYHPDKAKELLAEAGYPDGFTTSVTLSGAEEQNIDYASIVVAYWARVGVTLELDIKEVGVYNAIRRAQTYPGGAWSTFGTASVRKFSASRAGTTGNRGLINDPLVEELYLQIMDNYFDWSEVARIQREHWSPRR